VEFEVVPLQSAAPPPSTGPTQPPATQPSALGQDSATVLDALIALKMAEGSLPIDLGYDVDANGQVTADDARLILRWAVQ
ncbi:MAG: hypothetical protein JXA58_04150, partial [Dehalococcoidia bacterium]|nr:hypothetical protein [Dehalococcoidia bacterium]